MLVAFYIEPAVEMGRPLMKAGWIGGFSKKIAQSILQDDPNAEFIFIVPEALEEVVVSHFPKSRVVAINQQDITNRFGRSSKNIVDAWYRKTATEVQLKDMVDLIQSKTSDIDPDICISYSPAPFLEMLWRDCKISYVEFGMFSREPFEPTIFIDSQGILADSTATTAAADIKQRPVSRQTLDVMDRYRAHLTEYFTSDVNPIKGFLRNSLAQFEGLILCPLQFSNFYAFDAHCNFETQYDFLLDVLETAPSGYGVVVCEHPEHPVLNEQDVEYLKSKYGNLVWHSSFRNIYAVSSYIYPYVDAVVSVSSSVGLQSLFWQKPLVSLGDGPLTAYCDARHLSELKDIIEADLPEWKSQALVNLLKLIYLPIDYLSKTDNFLDYFVDDRKETLQDFADACERIGWDEHQFVEFFTKLCDRPIISSSTLRSDDVIFTSSLFWVEPTGSAVEHQSMRQLVSFLTDDTVEVIYRLDGIDQEISRFELGFADANITQFVSNIEVLIGEDRVWSLDYQLQENLDFSSEGLIAVPSGDGLAVYNLTVDGRLYIEFDRCLDVKNGQLVTVRYKTRPYHIQNVEKLFRKMEFRAKYYQMILESRSLLLDRMTDFTTNNMSKKSRGWLIEIVLQLARSIKHLFGRWS